MEDVVDGKPEPRIRINHLLHPAMEKMTDLLLVAPSGSTGIGIEMVVKVVAAGRMIDLQ